MNTLSSNSARARNTALIMLTIVYAFNFIDRQILVILQESIKVDLDLSDTQLGLLSGFSFALIYVIAGIPIAYWADRSNRRNIVALSLAVWSAMTALSGFVQNFIQLLLARVGVGLGEAGGSPPSHSMISDYFPEEQRARALSIYSIGIYIGIMLGFMFGGLLAQELGWRMAFVAVGIPGVLFAVVFKVLVKEPPRSVNIVKSPSLKETLKVIANRPSFWLLALGCGFIAFLQYGIGNFYPSFYIRNHGASIAQVGMILSLCAGIMGAGGTYLGGYLGDKLGKKDKRWYLWIPAITIFLTVPLTVACLLAESLHVAVFFMAIGYLFSSCYLSCCIAISHSIVPANMRAMSSALLFFTLNIIGLGIGPVFTGMLSDNFGTGMASTDLRNAMLVTAQFGFVSVIFMLWASTKVRADIESTEPVS